MDSSPSAPKPAEATAGGSLSHEPHLDAVRPEEWDRALRHLSPEAAKRFSNVPFLQFVLKFRPGSPTREQLKAEGINCFVWPEDDPSAVDLYKRVSPAKDQSTSRPREKGKRRAEVDESEQAAEKPVPKKPRIEVDLATWPKPPKITMWAGEVARVKGWGSNGLQTRSSVEEQGTKQRERREEGGHEGDADEFIPSSEFRVETTAGSAPRRSERIHGSPLDGLPQDAEDDDNDERSQGDERSNDQATEGADSEAQKDVQAALVEQEVYAMTDDFGGGWDSPAETAETAETTASPQGAGHEPDGEKDVTGEGVEPEPTAAAYIEPTETNEGQVGEGGGDGDGEKVAEAAAAADGAAIESEATPAMLEKTAAQKPKRKSKRGKAGADNADAPPATLRRSRRLDPSAPPLDDVPTSAAVETSPIRSRRKGKGRAETPAAEEAPATTPRRSTRRAAAAVESGPSVSPDCVIGSSSNLEVDVHDEVEPVPSSSESEDERDGTFSSVSQSPAASASAWRGQTEIVPYHLSPDARNHPRKLAAFFRNGIAASVWKNAGESAFMFNPPGRFHPGQDQTVTLHIRFNIGVAKLETGKKCCLSSDPTTLEPKLLLSRSVVKQRGTGQEMTAAKISTWQPLPLDTLTEASRHDLRIYIRQLIKGLKAKDYQALPAATRQCFERPFNMLLDDMPDRSLAKPGHKLRNSYGDYEKGRFQLGVSMQTRNRANTALSLFASYGRGTKKGIEKAHNWSKSCVLSKRHLFYGKSHVTVEFRADGPYVVELGEPMSSIVGEDGVKRFEKWRNFLLRA